MTVTQGCSAVKIDPAAEYLGLAHRQQTQILYDIPDISHLSQIKKTIDRNIRMEFPIDDVKTLYYLQPLEQQFATKNNSDESRVADEAVLKTISWAVKAAAVELPDDKIYRRRIKSVIVHDVYKLDSFSELVDRIQPSEPLGDQLGFYSQVDQSTLQRTIDRVDISRSEIQDIAVRVRHALARNGCLPPKWPSTSSHQSIPYNGTDRQRRQKAITHWGRILFSEVLPSNPFNRANNKSIEASEVVSSIAFAALQGNLASGATLLSWSPYNDVSITKRRLLQILRELSESEALQIARTLHERTLKLASKCEFFEDPQEVAIDPTWVRYGDEQTHYPEYMIENPHVSSGKHIHPVSAVTLNPESRFSIGVLVPSSKDIRPRYFRRLLRRLAEYARISLVTIDREFTGAPTIKNIRPIAHDNWIIRAKDIKGELRDFRNSLSTGESATRSGISLGKLSYDVNAFAYPYDNTKHYVYITDYDTNQYSPADIHNKYKKRWGIETFYRQIQQSFRPQTKSSSKTVRLLLWNFGSIFYNFYSLANRCVTPKYGIPLNVTSTEILLGIARAGQDDRIASNK